MSSTPLVVTHPCALVRDALDRILTKSQFRCQRSNSMVATSTTGSRRAEEACRNLSHELPTKEGVTKRGSCS